jgi:hypothetical protein
MKCGTLMGAALIAAIMPGVALADDPNDPTMRSAAAQARDRAMIRQLNLAERAKVRQRDARNMQAMQSARADADNYAARSRQHQRAMADYARDRAQHDRDMAAWRRAVAACRAGDYSACDR